jgi:putative component of membrane protein insertase Oxa1/YidC/SpoIIIJ protein YidD
MLLNKEVDRLLCYLAILSIRLYQIIGRPFVRKTCLFNPSCSRRAIFLFQKHSFKKAFQLTKLQLQRCNPDYLLYLNSKQEVELLTSTGEKFSQKEISPIILNRFESMRMMGISKSR